MALYPVTGNKSAIIALVIGWQIYLFLCLLLRILFHYICIYSLHQLFFKFVGDMDCYRSSETAITIHSFSGIFGIICSVGLLVITQKFAYGMLGLQTPIYLVFSAGLYIFDLNYYYKNHIKKLQETYQSKNQKIIKKKLLVWGSSLYIMINSLLISVWFCNTKDGDNCINVCIFQLFWFICFILLWNS